MPSTLLNDPPAALNLPMISSSTGLAAKVYYGTPCSTHASAPRYSSNRRCVECAKDERRAKAGQNKERERLRQQKRRDYIKLASSRPSPGLALLCEAIGLDCSGIDTPKGNTLQAVPTDTRQVTERRA